MGEGRGGGAARNPRGLSSWVPDIGCADSGMTWESNHPRGCAVAGILQNAGSP